MNDLQPLIRNRPAGANPSDKHIETCPLPQDIAFLIEAGFLPADLHLAAAEAERLGIAASEMIIGAGRWSERLYYRALANHLNLPFVDVGAYPIGEEAYTAGHLADRLLPRLLPIETARGRHYALMPRGREITALFAAMRRHDRPRQLVVASPSDGREALIAQAGAPLLSRYVDRLAHECEAMSARATPHRLGVALVGVLALSILLTLAELAGAPAFVWFTGFVALLLSLVFGLALGLRCAFLTMKESAKPRPLPARELPRYTLLVPIYRETKIVPQLLAALGALDYPAALVEIFLLVEEDDRDTIDAIHRADVDERCQLIRVPSGQPRTKPRALQFGLAFARGDIIAIYDAEDIPAPGQLRQAAAALAAGGAQLACVQAPLAIDNSDASWLTRQFALEYAALFRLIVPGLGRLGMPVMLGGTSNHFRATALRETLGWDAWNVTEDADLGIRLARFGYRTQAIGLETEEEAPVRFSGWFAQRRRWLKGWMQTALVHFSQPFRLARELGFKGVVGLAGTLLASLIAALIYPFSLIGVATLVTLGYEPGALIPIAVALGSMLLFLSGHALAAVSIVAGARQAGLQPRLRDLVSLPLYWSLISLAAWAALIDLVRRPFYWDKTAHQGRRRRPPPFDRAVPMTEAGF